MRARRKSYRATLVNEASQSVSFNSHTESHPPLSQGSVSCSYHMHCAHASRRKYMATNAQWSGSVHTIIMKKLAQWNTYPCLDQQTSYDGGKQSMPCNMCKGCRGMHSCGPHSDHIFFILMRWQHHEELQFKTHYQQQQ
jgi:hypothetical protein